MFNNSLITQYAKKCVVVLTGYHIPHKYEIHASFVLTRQFHEPFQNSVRIHATIFDQKEHASQCHFYHNLSKVLTCMCCLFCAVSCYFDKKKWEVKKRKFKNLRVIFPFLIVHLQGQVKCHLLEEATEIPLASSRSFSYCIPRTLAWLHVPTIMTQLHGESVCCSLD